MLCNKFEYPWKSYFHISDSSPHWIVSLLKHCVFTPAATKLMLIVIRKRLHCSFPRHQRTQFGRFFIYVSWSHHSLSFWSHINTPASLHSHSLNHSDVVQLLRHRWYNLSWLVCSGVRICWCSVPESWSSLEEPDNGQMAAHSAAPPSSTTHAGTPFSCPCCAVCRSQG